MKIILEVGSFRYSEEPCTFSSLHNFILHIIFNLFFFKFITNSFSYKLQMTHVKMNCRDFSIIPRPPSILRQCRKQVKVKTFNSSISMMPNAKILIWTKLSNHISIIMTLMSLTIIQFRTSQVGFNFDLTKAFIKINPISIWCPMQGDTHKN